MARDDWSESAWTRGWVDTKRGLADWRFWLVEVVGGGAVGMYYNDAFPAIVFVLGMAFCIWLGATTVAPVRQRNEARQFIKELEARQALSVVFPPEANMPNKITAFRSVTTFLPSGRPFAPPLPTEHLIYIGVTNNASRTVRNVGVRAYYANIPDRPIDLRLFAKGTKKSRIDIAPRMTELFWLGEALRREESEFAGFEHQIVEVERVRLLAGLADKNQHIGLEVHHDDGIMPLLRNDEQVLRVMAHGDDVEPSPAEISLDMKREITIEVRSLDSFDGDASTSDRL